MKEEKEIISEYFNNYYPQKRTIVLNEVAEEIAGTLSGGANIAGSAIGFGALALVALIIYFLIRDKKPDYGYVTGNVRNSGTYDEMTSTLDQMITGKNSPQDQTELENYKKDLEQFKKEDQRIIDYLQRISKVDQTRFEKDTISGIKDLSEILLKIQSNKNTADEEIRVRKIVLDIQKNNPKSAILQKICTNILDSLKNKEEIINKATGYQKLILKLSTKYPKIPKKFLSRLMFLNEKEADDLLKKAAELENNKEKIKEFLAGKPIPFVIEKKDDETGINIKISFNDKKQDGKISLGDKIEIAFDNTKLNSKFIPKDLIIEEDKDKFLLNFVELQNSHQLFYKKFLETFNGEIAELKNFKPSPDNLKDLKSLLLKYIDPNFLEKISEYQESSEETQDKNADFKGELDSQINVIIKNVLDFVNSEIKRFKSETLEKPNLSKTYALNEIIKQIKNLRLYKKQILFINPSNKVEKEYNSFFEQDMKRMISDFIKACKAKITDLKILSLPDDAKETVEKLELEKKVKDEKINQLLQQIKDSKEEIKKRDKIINDIQPQNNDAMSDLIIGINDLAEETDRIEQIMDSENTQTSEVLKTPEKPLIEKLKNLDKEEGTSEIIQNITLDIKNKKFTSADSESDFYIKFLKNGNLEIYSKGDLKDLKDFKKDFVFESKDDYKLVFKGKYKIESPKKGQEGKINIYEITPVESAELEDINEKKSNLISDIKQLKEDNDYVHIDVNVKEDNSTFERSDVETIYKALFYKNGKYEVRSNKLQEYLDPQEIDNLQKNIKETVFESEEKVDKIIDFYQWILYSGTYKIKDNKIVISTIEKGDNDNFIQQKSNKPGKLGIIGSIENLKDRSFLFNDNFLKGKYTELKNLKDNQNYIKFYPDGDQTIAEFHIANNEALKLINNMSHEVKGLDVVSIEETKKDIFSNILYIIEVKEKEENFEDYINVKIKTPIIVKVRVGVTTTSEEDGKSKGLLYSLDVDRFSLLKKEIIEKLKGQKSNEKDQKKNDIRNYIRGNEYFIFEKNKLTPAGNKKPTDKTFLQIYLNLNTENPFKGTFSINPKDSTDILKYLESNKDLIIDTGDVEVVYDSYNGLFKNLIKIFEAEATEKRKFPDLSKEFEQLDFTYKSDVSFELSKDNFEFKKGGITFKNFFEGYKKSIAQKVFSKKQDFFKSQIEGKDKNGLIKLKEEYKNYVESFPADGEPYTENAITAIQSAIDNFDKIEGNDQLLFEKYLDVLTKLNVLKKKNGLNINEKRLLNLIENRFLTKNIEEQKNNEKLISIINKINGLITELQESYGISKINDLSIEQIKNLDEFIFKLNNIKAIKDEQVELGKPIDIEEKDDTRLSVEDKKETQFFDGEKWKEKEIAEIFLQSDQEWETFCYYIEIKDKKITIFKDEKKKKEFYIVIKNNEDKKDFKFEIRKKQKEAINPEFDNSYFYQEAEKNKISLALDKIIEKISLALDNIYSSKDQIIYTGSFNIGDKGITFSNVEKYKEKNEVQKKTDKKSETNVITKIKNFFKSKEEEQSSSEIEPFTGDVKITNLSKFPFFIGRKEVQQNNSINITISDDKGLDIVVNSSFYSDTTINFKKDKDEQLQFITIGKEKEGISIDKIDINDNTFDIDENKLQKAFKDKDEVIIQLTKNYSIKIEKIKKEQQEQEKTELTDKEKLLKIISFYNSSEEDKQKTKNEIPDMFDAKGEIDSEKLRELKSKLNINTEKDINTILTMDENVKYRPHKNINHLLQEIFVKEIKKKFILNEQEESNGIKTDIEVDAIKTQDDIMDILLPSNIYLIDLNAGNKLEKINKNNPEDNQKYNELKNGIVFYQKNNDDFHQGQLKINDLNILLKNEDLLKIYFDFNKENEDIKTAISEAADIKYPDVLSGQPCKVKIDANTSIENKVVVTNYNISVIKRGTVSTFKFLEKFKTVDQGLKDSLKQVIKKDLQEKPLEKPEEIKQEEKPTEPQEVTTSTTDQYFISLDDIKNKKKKVTDSITTDTGIIFNRVKNKNPKNEKPNIFDGHLWIKQIDKKDQLIGFNEIIALKDYFNFNLQDFIINEEIQINDYKNQFLSAQPLKVTIINNEITSIISKGDIQDKYYTQLEISKKELLKTEIEKTSKEDAYKKFGLMDLLTSEKGQEKTEESPTGFIAKKESSVQGFLIPKNYNNINKVLDKKGYKVYYYIKNGEDYYYIDFNEKISHIIKILIKNAKFFGPANALITLDKEVINSEIKLKDLKTILKVTSMAQAEFADKKMKFKFGKIQEKIIDRNKTFFKFPLNTSMQPKIGDGKEQGQGNQTAVPQTEEFFENLIIKNIWKK